jgi:hypothetical protein
MNSRNGNLSFKATVVLNTLIHSPVSLAYSLRLHLRPSIRSHKRSTFMKNTTFHSSTFVFFCDLESAAIPFVEFDIGFL